MRDVIRMNIPSRPRLGLLALVAAIEATSIVGLHLAIDYLSLAGVLSLATVELTVVILLARAFGLAPRNVGVSRIPSRELVEAFSVAAVAATAAIMHGAVQLSSSVIVQVILYAAGEELVWRGVAIPQVSSMLSARFSKPAAVLGAIGITSLVFAMSHLIEDTSIEAVAGTMWGGVLLGALYALTSRLWVPLVVHIASNLLVLSVGPSLVSLAAQAAGVVIIGLRFVTPAFRRWRNRRRARYS